MKETIVAIIDGGGRGAALVEAYAKSPHVDKILSIPLIDMMPFVASGKLIQDPYFKTLKTNNKKEILKICKEYKVTLLDVPQDEAVESGLTDDARQMGILTVGPSRDAGEIEWNKIFSRQLGKSAGIRQPRFHIWDNQDNAINYYCNTELEQPFFVKASGLAAGKGVIPARNKEELSKAIMGMGQFGEKGRRFLVEEWLKGDDGSLGEEFSYFVLCQGREFVYLGSAQDNKTVGNRDEGPNTGGMGGHNEPVIVDEKMRKNVEETIIAPILEELIKEKRPYGGVLYFSGMRVLREKKYVPYTVEFNARLGDPEAQLILPGIKNDWFETMMMVAEGKSIKDLKIENDSLKRVCITIASLGYPGDYSKVLGKKIYGIEDVFKMDGVRVYGAGVEFDGDVFRVKGGRLLYVVGEGENIIIARQRAYAAASHIIVYGNNQIYRDDIAIRDAIRFHQGRF